jgi:hypothetical protein
MTSTRRYYNTAGCALAASGCFGKFGATNALYDWNTEVSDNKWLRWLVFLVLAILPVYGLFILADVLVLNTIEFFTDDNPVSGGHVKRELPDGHSVTSTRTQDPDVVRHEVRKDGKLIRVAYVKRTGDELWLLDEQRRPLSRVRRLPDGSVELIDGDGRPLSVVTPEQQQRIADAARRGESAAAAARAAMLSAPGVVMASGPPSRG